MATQSKKEETAAPLHSHAEVGSKMSINSAEYQYMVNATEESLKANQERLKAEQAEIKDEKAKAEKN